MSTFTIRLMDLVDSGFSLGLTPTDYPIFDEAHREPLNQKIVDHYANYEIGQETESMFRFALNRRMREIMPYYNQLYESEKLVYDPLTTVDYADSTTSETDGTTGTTGTSDSTSDSTSKSRAVNAEMPQVRLSPDEDYATSSADSVSDTSATGAGTNEATTTEAANGTVSHTVNGRQGSANALLMEYRATLLNIDMMVVSELNNLFMGVWDNGDEFSATNRIYYYGSSHFPF